MYSYFCFKSEIKQIATFKTYVSSLHIPQSLPHARTSVYKPVFNRLLTQVSRQICSDCTVWKWIMKLPVFCICWFSFELLKLWISNIIGLQYKFLLYLRKNKMPNWSKHLDEFSECPKLSKDKLTFMNMRFCPYAQRVRLVLDAKKIP